MRLRYVSIFGALVLSTISVLAAPEPTNPDRQTPWKLYVDSKKPSR